MSNLNKPKVYIVEDDNAICQALLALFKSVQLEVETFSSAHAFLEAYNPSWLGCILLDVRLPTMSGLELQEKLLAQGNKLPLIFMTGYADVPMSVRAMKAGAFDFITKPFNNQLLVEQVQKAIAASLSAKPTQTESPDFSSLTARERDVLNHLADGKLNKEIAVLLNISISTVELHRARIMQKMHAKTLAELIKKYVLINYT